MATLTLIAEPFPDWEAEAHRAAARDLTLAVGATAPRGCSARYLAAKGAEAPEFQSARIRVDELPMRAAMLPYLWQSGATARPLDGEFVHSLTPMVPLRSRGEDDGSQTSVSIPHSIAWEEPRMLGSSQSRLFRAYARRSIKFADAILTPTHATAEVLQRHYGEDLPVQVMPLAPPAEFVAGDDAELRRSKFPLPEYYAVTTAMPGEFGRLEWVFEAMRLDAGTPPLVVIEGLDPHPAAKDARADASGAGLQVPADLAGRVVVLQPTELADIGAILDAAAILLQPQAYSGAGYLVLGALSAALPVLHAGQQATAELALDAGISAPESGEFAAEFGRLFRDTEALAQLSVLSADRGRGFSWHSAALQLWETHANL